jgi:hypothetical protein
MKAFFIALFLLLPTLNDPTPLVWEDLMDVEWTYDGEFYQVKFGESNSVNRLKSMMAKRFWWKGLCFHSNTLESTPRFW